MSEPSQPSPAPEPVGGSPGWPTVFAALIEGRNLDRDQAEAAMTEILGGNASPVQVAALLTGLAAKGEAAK